MKYFTFLFFTIFSAKKVYAIECPKDHFSVRSHSRNAYTKTDGTSVLAANVKEQCRPYRILKTPEPKFMTIIPKDWPNPKERFKDWTKEEKTRIRAVLGKLPKSLTNIGEIKFYRSTEKSSNPAVSNSENQIIVLYDGVTTNDLARVISHELAHFYWDSLDRKNQKEYHDAAGWIVNSEQTAISLQRKNIPIQDSYTGPHEDFSNSVELFLQNKETFKDHPILLKCLEKFIQ